MVVGIVKKIIVDKGYGFIKPEEGGADIFFHHTSLLNMPIEELGLGQAVEYELVAGQEGKGPRAINVSPVD